MMGLSCEFEAAPAPSESGKVLFYKVRYSTRPSIKLHLLLDTTDSHIDSHASKMMYTLLIIHAIPYITGIYIELQLQSRPKYTSLTKSPSKSQPFS